jgi:arabinose-5-phosphate isomerase
MIEKIKNLIIEEMAAIANIPVNNSYKEAINLIYKKVHLLGGKLITSGMGKAGQIALNIATTFSSTGTCAVYLHPSEAQHGDLGILRENDVLLLLSNSGKTREIVELITLAGNLHPGIEIICITGNPESELANGSDVILLTGGSPEICPLGLTPTTSTTLMTIIGDMLVVTLMEKIEFTKEEYSKRHHSGYLGSKSRGES